MYAVTPANENNERDADGNLLLYYEYKQQFGCGECVARGYNYCWKATVPGQVLAENAIPYYDTLEPEKSSGICCKSDEDSENCSMVSGADWLCSWSYGEPIYSLHICPFKRSACGPNSVINMYEEGEDGAIPIKDLANGESCTYEVNTVCGAPAYSTSESTDTKIYHAEWQLNRVDVSFPVIGKAPTDDSLMNASPLEDMPQRNYRFANETGRLESDNDAAIGNYTFNGWKAWGNNDQGNVGA